MIFKSDWSGWIVLAAIVVFPSMFYLTQPENVLEKTDSFEVGEGVVSSSAQQTRTVYSEPLSISSENSAHSSVSQKDVNITVIKLDEELADTSNIPAPQENLFGVDKSFLSAEVSTRLAMKERRQTDFSRSDFSVSNRRQRQTTSVPATDVARASASSLNKTTAQPEDNTINENAYLYLAEMDYSEPESNAEKKCPPVYQTLNDYARNMRITMGCDSE